MPVLSYDTAKRSLIRTSVYLVSASLVIQGVGHLLEFNVISAFQGMLAGDMDHFSLQLPEFNMDSISFDLVAAKIKEKIEEFISIVVPSGIGLINVQLLHAATTNKAVVTGATQVALKA